VAAIPVDLANRAGAYLEEVSNCLRIGAGWTDKLRLAAATLAFHADKTGSNASASSEEYAIQGQRGDYRIRLRPRTGDVFIFHEIFTFKAYELPRAMLVERRIRTVVDLGANIGLASLYFHDALAPEVLVAVEPVASNFSMLKGTLSPLPGAIACEQAAVGRTAGVATIVDAAAPTWGAQFSAGGSGGNAVRQTTVPEIMRAHGLDRIGLLKMDIEGAEEDVFAGDFAWLDKVDVLLVELHTDLAVTRFRAAASLHGFRDIVAPSGQCVIAAGPGVDWF
jgi:FkbM family methyltransferase